MNYTKAPTSPETLHVLANTLRYTNQPAFGEMVDNAGDTIAAQAARIAELEARVKELEAALEPFVNAAKVIHPAIDDRDGLWTASSNGVHTKITAGDCRHARALLETK